MMTMTLPFDRTAPAAAAAPAKIATVHARRFILAGQALFTLVSNLTGKHYTYEVRSTDPERTSFTVAVRAGDDFLTVGVLAAGEFVADGKGPAAKAFAWYWRQLSADGPKLDQVELMHAGRCGRCGRELTHPESILTGLGPICAGRGDS